MQIIIKFFFFARIERRKKVTSKILEEVLNQYKYEVIKFVYNFENSDSFEDFVER